MKTLHKRATSLLLTACMVLSLMPAIAPTAKAASGTNFKAVKALTKGDVWLDVNTVYTVNGTVRILSPNTFYPGLGFNSGGTTVIYLAPGSELTVFGASGSSVTPGTAAINLQSGNTLVITGSGTLIATGGDAARADLPGDGRNAVDAYGGMGGYGSRGGGGAAAGIGGRGGTGGDSGEGAEYVKNETLSGIKGKDGSPGSNGDSSGTLYVLGSVAVTGTGGSAGLPSVGGTGGKGGGSIISAIGGGGGGGGGADGGGSASGIGGGGGGAAGGGGGGSGSATAVGLGKAGAGLGGEGTNGSNGENGGGNTSTTKDMFAAGPGGAAGTPNGVAGSSGAVYKSAGVRKLEGASKTTVTSDQNPALAYTITLSQNDSTSGGASKSAYFGIPLENVTPPTRSGYDFLGYTTTASGSTYVYDKNGAPYPSIAGYTDSAKAGISGNTTLYAQWKQSNQTFNTPDPVTQNGLTASAVHNPASPAAIGSAVQTTVKLNGKAALSGMHLVTARSTQLGASYTANFPYVVTAGQNVNATLGYPSFVVPSTSVTDIAIEHKFVPMPTLYSQTYVYDGSPKPYVIGTIPSMTVKTTTYRQLSPTSGIETTSPPITAGEYSVNIEFNALGADFPVNKTLVITPRPLAWDTSGLTIQSKEYDGTTKATVSGSGIALKGVLDADKGGVSFGGLGITSGTFESAAVGTSKLVTLDTGKVTIGGASALNYTLPSSPPTGRASIRGLAPIFIYKDVAPTTVYNGGVQAVSDIVDAEDANVAGFVLDGVDEANLTYKYYTDAACTFPTGAESGVSVAGSAPVKAGTYYIRVTYTPDESQQQYAGADSAIGKIKYIITPKAIDPSLSWTAGQADWSYTDADNIAHSYTGTALAPTLTIVQEGVTLIEGKDYTVAYANNKSQGVATATVTYIDNYKNTAPTVNNTKLFTITKGVYDLSGITLTDKAFAYDGQPHSQEIDSLTKLKTIDPLLNIAYTWIKEGEGGTVLADTPSGAGKYTVTATITTNNGNMKFSGADTDKYVLTATLNINHNQVDITFDLADATVDGSPDDVILKANLHTAIKENGSGLPVPLRAGYNLAGWESNDVTYKNQSAGNVMVAGAQTFTAVWTEAQSKVTFDATGGEFPNRGGFGKIYYQPFLTKFNFADVATPSQANKKFAGWATTKGGAPETGASFFFDSTDLINGKTYYAVWSEQEYLITLHYNGGTVLEDGKHIEVTQRTIVNGQAIGAVDTPTSSEQFEDGSGGAQDFTFLHWADANLPEAASNQLTPEALAATTPTSDMTYIAVWNGPKITVTHAKYAGDSSTRSYNVTKLTNGTKIATPMVVAPPGQTFQSWKVTQSRDATFSVGQILTAEEISSAVAKDDVTFEALFDVKQVHYTFNLNGGNVDGAAVDVTGQVPYNTAPTVPNAVKKGYILKYWLNINTGALIPPADFAIAGGAIEEDSVFVAQWSENQVAVTFDANGGIGTTPLDLKMDDVVDVSKIPHPTRSNYRFLGWATTDNALAPNIAANAKLDVTATVTYYAVWARVTTQVKFMEQNGTTPIAGGETTVPSGDTISTAFTSEPIPEPIAGYTFQGWGIPEQAGMPMSWDTVKALPVSTDMTFAARYTINQYTLTFDASTNGGSIPPAVRTADYGTIFQLSDIPLPTAPVGYVFTGWYTTSAGIGDALTSYILNDNAILYARYTPASVSYLIDNYQQNTAGTNYTLMHDEECRGGLTGAEPTLNFRNYPGFVKNEALTTFENSGTPAQSAMLTIAADGSLVVRLYYDRLSYNVTYSTGSGAGSGAKPVSEPDFSAYNALDVKYGSPMSVQPNLTADGWTFSGWSSGEVIPRVDGSYDMPNQSVIFGGSWTPVGYHVMYDLAGGTGSIIDNATYHVDATATISTTIPTREGFTFTGWAADNVVLGADDTQFIMPAKDVKLTAQWRTEMYTVTYMSQGTVFQTQNASFGTQITILNPPVLSGQTFVGWRDGEVTYTAGAKFSMPPKDVTLTADWGNPTYRIDCELNDGFPSATMPSSYRVGDSFLFPAATREGYVFGGWYSDAEFKTEKKGITPDDKTNLTIYAKWEPSHGGGGGGGGTVTVVQLTPGKNKNQASIILEKNAKKDDVKVYAVADRNGKALKEGRDIVIGLMNAKGWVSVHTTVKVDAKSNITVTLPADGCTIVLLDPITFADAGQSDWFFKSVQHVFYNDLMQGTGPTTYEPHTITSRAMMVTLLYRMAEAKSTGDTGFADVPSGIWYSDPIGWAAKNSYAMGFDDGMFHPEEIVTREQMATFLYRFAGSPTSSQGLEQFIDASSISVYSVPAVRWAVEQGLLTGKGDGVLDPTGYATRAELSAIIARYLKLA